MSSAHEPVTLITGTSSGFGLSTSIALARRGHHVIATMRDLGNQSALERSAREAGVRDRIHMKKLDVTLPEEASTVVREVIRDFRRIDVLINNAGFALGGFVEQVSLEQWKEQFETNFFGLVAVTQAVLPHMRVQRSGRIVNVSSISGQFGFPGMGPYVASKFAVEGFSESLRLEMVPFGVDVVLIEPASYRTAIWRKGLEQAREQLGTQSGYEQESQRMLRQVEAIAAAGGNPEEVARLIERIVTSTRPGFRHAIGQGTAALMFAKRLLPWSWLEWVVARRFRGD